MVTVYSGAISGVTVVYNKVDRIGMLIVKFAKTFGDIVRSVKIVKAISEDA